MFFNLQIYKVNLEETSFMARSCAPCAPHTLYTPLLLACFLIYELVSQDTIPYVCRMSLLH